MSKVFNPTVLRVAVLPLLGAVGAIIALVYPSGHAAFCAGLNSLVV